METKLIKNEIGSIDIKVTIDSSDDVSAFKVWENCITASEVGEMIKSSSQGTSEVSYKSSLLIRQIIDEIHGAIHDSDLFIDNIIKISDDYEAEICEDGAINVGCQHIEFNKLHAVYLAARKVRGES